ncbi:MAG: Gfo/Idh/MocA family oxidoreductase [Acidobacteriota bacterium]
MNKDGPAIAIIGCGAWGMNHVRVWSELTCLRLACDVATDRREAVQARYPQVETCGEANTVLSRADISAVVIATPAAGHAALALQALEADKDVLVEKPMALTAVEGERLVEAARRRRRVLMVGHVLEYHPAVQKLKELVQTGSLGRLQYIYSNRLNLGRIRIEESALWSFAPHDVAIILRLLGTMPEEVSCHGGDYLNHGVADVTLTSLCFPSQVRAHIFVSWLHPYKDHRFVLVGEEKMAVFDDTRPWPEKLTLYPHRVDWLQGQIPVAHKAQAVPVPLEEAEPLRVECQQFFQCLTTREQPLTDAESGLRVLRVLEAAQRSLEQGSQPVRLDGSSPASTPYYAHPTATVDADAKVGAETKIWHYSHVMAGARLGRNCILGQNVFVGCNVRIGDGVKIQNNVSVYEGVELENHVFCGPSMVFTNVINPRSEIERKREFWKTLVKRGATLGANCTILCGVTIGLYAMVGAGSVVTKDVPDYALVTGVPARITGWVCECANKLGLVRDRATCSNCGKEYRCIGENQLVRMT